MGKDPEGMSLPGMVGLQCVCVRARVCVSAPTLYMCRYTCVHVHICVCNWLICVYVYAHVYA